MPRLLFAIAASALFLALTTPALACDKCPPQEEKAGAKGKDGSFGAAIANTDKAVALDELLAKPAAQEGKGVVVKGQISRVCLKKGCWFVLQGKDKSTSVRITMKGYGFFVPTDCAGRQAVVAGTFTVKTVTEAMRKHLAQDEGKDPAQVKGDTREYSLVATGVVLN
jgi:hypothetical protein